MKAYGSKRTHGGCLTSKSAGKKKIKVRVTVKNGKRTRASDKGQESGR